MTGHVLALDVFPDVQLGPVQQRVNADVGARLEVRLELVPQLGRLVLDVPFHVLVARAEVAFLGPGRFLVAADADDDAVVVVLVEHRLEGVLLQDAAALDARGFAVRVGAAWPGAPLCSCPRRAGVSTRGRAGRGTRSCWGSCSWYPRAPAGRAHGRRRPCAPATTARSSLCQCSTAWPGAQTC